MLMINSITHNNQTLGYSTSGLSIPIIKNSPRANVLMVGGVHGREHITVDLLIALLPTILRYPIDVVPMLNPDGTVLAKDGICGLNLSPEEEKRLIEINGNSHDFTLWKSNGKGVDINVNFDADWGKGVGNRLKPGSESYIGEAPESESETKCMANLLRERRYSLVVAYHSKGMGKHSNLKGMLTYILRIRITHKSPSVYILHT